MRYEFELAGRRPLLMHADDVAASDGLMAWRKDPANKNLSIPGDDRSPGWTWQTYLYADPESGHVAMPSDNIMVCLRQAGAQLILKKHKTYKEITQSGMLIEEEFCPFFCNGKQVPLGPLEQMRDDPFKKQAEVVDALGFTLFMKRARVGQSKHVRVRPRFNSWSVKGSLTVFKDAELSEDVLKQIFEIAGTVGLCDWRPGCKTPGAYGMFNAKIWKVK